MLIVCGGLIFACAQAQSSIPLPEIPREQWGLQGQITADNDLTRYTIHLERHSAMHFNYVIHTKDIRFSVLDSDAKPVSNAPRLSVAPNTSALIKPSLDQYGFEVVDIKFVLDRANAKPGYYLLFCDVPADAVDQQTHKPIRIRNGRARLIVYLTPQPDREPILRIGQKFIAGPWNSIDATVDTPYRDTGSNNPIKWRDLVGRIAALQRIEPEKNGCSRLTFGIWSQTDGILNDNII